MFSERVSQSFSLNLEVLKGCGFSCTGCTIEKNLAPLDISDEDVEDLLSLLEGLKQTDFRMFELKIGPTDLASADNGLAVLEHPAIKKIADYFRSITVNMAMLNDNYLVEIAERLDVIAAGKYVNLVMPITIKNACNEKWMDILRKRLVYFQSLLKQAKFTRVFVTVNVEEENLAQFNDLSFSKLRDIDLGEGFDKVIEFPFVNVRKDLGDIVAIEKFKRDLKVFADFVKTKVHTHEFVHLIPGHVDGYEYTYRTGSLYSTIVLVENLTIFRDAFKVKKPWSAESIVADREESYLRILEDYSDHPQCGTCCYFDNCARYDVQRLMEVTHSKTCLMEMHNRWDLQGAPDVYK